MLAVARATNRRAFTLGFIAGAIYFTGTLYWITRVMAVYGGLTGWVAVAVNALLIAYLSLFPALFAAATAAIIRKFGSTGVLAAPLTWVASELGRTYLLTGFPWVLLGYSQTRVLPVAQLASVTGVYGVSMLVAAVSAASVFAIVNGPIVSGGARRRFMPVIAVFTVIVAIAGWGSRRVTRSALTHTGEEVRIGLVQGNVDQGIKWDPSRAAAIFADHIRQTRQALGAGSSLVLWPESSTPFMFEEDTPSADQVRALARQARASILFGSDQIEWRTEHNKRVPAKYFNSAFLVRPDGTTAGVYRKMHLVPFGEYVPLQRLLFFAAPLTEQVGTFSAGLQPELLPIGGHRLSVAICYEVVYPNLVRQFVAAGSELLTTITNDAWFGETSAPYQHFEQAAMRAIEEGRYLVRAANTGVSGIVDPYGRILEQTPIFQRAVVVGDARFLSGLTIYARCGDIAAYLSLAATLALLLVPRRVK